MSAGIKCLLGGKKATGDRKVFYTENVTWFMSFEQRNSYFMTGWKNLTKKGGGLKKRSFHCLLSM